MYCKLQNMHEFELELPRKIPILTYELIVHAFLRWALLKIHKAVEALSPLNSVLGGLPQSSIPCYYRYQSIFKHYVSQIGPP